MVMARMARAVAVGVPHHVTQRGNRRQPTFFGDGDYRLYQALLADACRRRDVAVWAWCLMPNHVHLLLVPATAEALRLALGEAHQRYTRTVNRREGWTGHLWQGRFASAALGEGHLVAAARYIELNPVRAGLVQRPEQWRWSSARAHLAGRGDGLVRAHPLPAMIPDWRAFLDAGVADGEADALRRSERTGRPLGDDAFLADLETRLGRRLRPGRRGPKPKAERTERQDGRVK